MMMINDYTAVSDRETGDIHARVGTAQKMFKPLFCIKICLTSLTRAKPKEKMEFPT